jgi:hypothetical protein
MKKKIVALVLTALLIIPAFTGCRRSDIVSYNVSKEADNFDVTRKITVINARTDSVVFELEGVFSLSNTSARELTVICKTNTGYKKHFIYLNENTLYFVEDIGGADVSSLSYKVNFFPQQIGNVIDVDVDWVD